MKNIESFEICRKGDFIFAGVAFKMNIWPGRVSTAGNEA